jgi:hypothetical protein
MQRQTDPGLTARLLYDSELISDYDRQIGSGHGLIDEGNDKIT